MLRAAALQLVPSKTTSTREFDDTVRITSLDRPALTVLRCCELTVNGFSLHTDAGVVPGIPIRFEFLCRDGYRVTLPAVAVHCHRVAGGSPRFFSGWEFISDAAFDPAVDALVQSATTARRA
jgi:hypothetical protein